jgi:excisionase family DNA binding protein
MSDHEQLLTVGEVAQQLGLSISATRRRVATGELRAIRLGEPPAAPVRVRADDLEDYVERHRVGSPA